jgi:hypothetical protein
MACNVYYSSIWRIVNQESLQCDVCSKIGFVITDFCTINEHKFQVDVQIHKNNASTLYVEFLLTYLHV